jgi:hypothetical protein
MNSNPVLRTSCNLGKQRSTRLLVLAGAALLFASPLPTFAADAVSPAPSTITVRLNGRFRLFAFGAFDGEANNNAAGTPTGTVNAAGQGTATGKNKLANYGIAEFARLYPGFDGVAANGLKYGANLEIREDNVSGAGGGAFGSVSQQDRARGALYFRREWGYLGTDRLGTLRVGSTDQPTSLYLTGNFENFNDGGIDGDAPAALAQNLLVTWPFEDVGSYYTTNKVVYLSPQLYGFDFGVSFEPSTANVNINSGCGAGGSAGTNFVNPAGTFTAAAGANGQSVAGPGCDRLSSSPNNAESGRRRNTIDALLRYRGAIGPVGIAATAAYIAGGHVLDNQTGVPFNSNPAGRHHSQRFRRPERRRFRPRVDLWRAERGRQVHGRALQRRRAQPGATRPGRRRGRPARRIVHVRPRDRRRPRPVLQERRRPRQCRQRPPTQ